MDESTKKELLRKLFLSFQNGLRAPKAERPKRYLKDLKLDYMELGLGFNSGQFHHRESEEFKTTHAELGVLRLNPNVGVNKEGRVPYTSFGKYGIMFPLKDQWGEIVNLYSDRFKLERPKREYLYEGVGIYPNYPKPKVNELFVCNDIYETASFMQSDLLSNRQSAIALFEGKLSEEIHMLIESRENIERIVLLSSSKSKKVLNELIDAHPLKQVSKIELGTKSIQDYLKNDEIEKLQSLIDKSDNAKELTSIDFKKELEVINPQKLGFKGRTARFEVVGKLSLDLGQLRVSLRMIHAITKKVYRTKVDLFESSDIQNKVNQLSSDFEANKLEADFNTLTELLENYRDELFREELKSTTSEVEEVKELTPKAKAQAMTFLSQKNLLVAIDKLIETAGIIGEESSRRTAFIIASSYKMPYPLHGLIQASSGKGKSHLINSVASLMPSEDVINLSRITSRSLYNYQNDELMYKLILIQDEDGLDEESLYAFRELQSAGFLSSSTSSKNSFGKHQSRVTRVNSHFSSLMASTKTEIYTDNESRSIVIGIDESDEQTRRIIDFTNKVRAGLIEKETQAKAKQLLRNAMRLLQRKEVINPFAHKIRLPIEAKTLRRLNSQFQDFIAQITLLNQFQRETDNRERVVTTTEDIKEGIDIFFTSIMFKIDELDSSSRQLFEKLKTYVENTPKGTKHEFTRKEIRTALNLKKTKTGEFIALLQELEYISITSGSANKGYFYSIEEWEEGLNKLRTRIRQDLQEQLNKLKVES